MITEFYWINTGFTTGREWLTKGNYGLRRLIFPAYCGLLKDDQFGYILFDTGYGPFFSRRPRSGHIGYTDGLPLFITILMKIYWR